MEVFRFRNERPPAEEGAEEGVASPSVVIVGRTGTGGGPIGAPVGILVDMMQAPCLSH
jgi:hypothetical protein